MSEFWKSIPTIQAERGGGYTAFPLFGTTHLTELAIAAAVIALISWWYHRSTAAGRRRILVAVTVLLLADEGLKYVAMLATDQWSWVYLPLHLCSINLFVCTYHTWKGAAWCREELYALCLPGALIALLLPGWQAAPPWNIMHLHSYTVHVMLMLYPILLLVGGFRPSPRCLPQSLAFLYGTAIPIYFLNKVLDTNFYFLNEPYSNAATILFASWLGEKWYFLAFIPLSLVVLCVMVLPWMLPRKRP